MDELNTTTDELNTTTDELDMLIFRDAIKRTTNLTDETEGSEYYIILYPIKCEQGELLQFVDKHEVNKYEGTYKFMGLMHTNTDIFYEFKNKDKGKLYLRRVLTINDDYQFCTYIEKTQITTDNNIYYPATINRILSNETIQHKGNSIAICEMLLCNVYTRHKVLRYDSRTRDFVL
jgi:hypothetical protein